MSEIDVTKCRFYNTNNGFTGAYCTAHNNYCRYIRNCYYKQLYRYKQAIKDIKEIAEKIDDSGGCVYGDYNCDNCSSIEQEDVCTYKVKKLILQKIREVE